jgi:hypothetical protein
MSRDCTACETYASGAHPSRDLTPSSWPHEPLCSRRMPVHLGYGVPAACVLRPGGHATHITPPLCIGTGAADLLPPAERSAGSGTVGTWPGVVGRGAMGIAPRVSGFRELAAPGGAPHVLGTSARGPSQALCAGRKRSLSRDKAPQYQIHRVPGSARGVFACAAHQHVRSVSTPGCFGSDAGAPSNGCCGSSTSIPSGAAPAGPAFGTDWGASRRAATGAV